MKNSEKEQFYQNVASLCNYRDVKLVKDIYFAIIRAIVRRLRETGKCEMPDFGKFYIKDYQRRKMKDVRTGKTIYMEQCKIVKYKPDYKLKAYFRDI